MGQLVTRPCLLPSAWLLDPRLLEVKLKNLSWSYTNMPPEYCCLFFVLALALQVSSLPCPAPDSPCALEASTCLSGELVNITICASVCQECAREEGGACEWSAETRGAGLCASGLECRGEECIVDHTALPACCAQPGGCTGVPGVCRRGKRSSGGAANVERRCMIGVSGELAVLPVDLVQGRGADPLWGRKDLRWSTVTAKVTAATTTRTQMQLSRKLMRRLYRSSPWEFSKSLWTN